MTSIPIILRPHDVCVGLQWLLTPEATYRELASCVGLSLGEAHNATRRLEIAQLLQPASRVVQRGALLEFLIHGVPYAYPGQLGPETQGVPTAYSGPALAREIAGTDVIVWPSVRGEARGSALVPLCNAAPLLREKNPDLYRWLTIVDAIRVGRSRERSLARSLLESEILKGPEPHA